MRALIADDEPIARQTLREHLEEVGDVEIVGEAANGAEAAGAVQQLSPDVVFLDLQMPEMDGFAVVRSLRGQPSPLVVCQPPPEPPSHSPSIALETTTRLSSSRIGPVRLFI